MKSNNLSQRKKLEKLYQAQEQDFKNMTNFDCDFNQYMANFGELKDNSKQIYQIMLDQNTIVQDTLSLTEEILNSLKTFFQR